uniref:Bromo domain-containing protein n=1 Tax=Athene cunicularia TaxID=194338 RepID=A0A663MQB3_ATHCN
MSWTLQFWIRVQRNCCLSLYVCLQVGHAWVWWESETESPSESEKNSDFQSLHSWDSVLDLDVRSWRNTEEVAMGKLDKSSPEAGHELELSERLWEDDSEDYQKAERPCEDDSILQLFSEQGDGEDVRCQEKTTRTAVSGTEESQQHILLNWDNPLQHFLFKRTLLSIWKMVVSHRYPEEYLGCNLIFLLSMFYRPMDLTSIKRRLSKGHIQSMAQFQRDLMLMFQNAVMYNSFNHHVHHMAMEMQREVLEQLQMRGTKKGNRLSSLGKAAV